MTTQTERYQCRTCERHAADVQPYGPNDFEIVRYGYCRHCNAYGDQVRMLAPIDWIDRGGFVNVVIDEMIGNVQIKADGEIRTAACDDCGFIVDAPRLIDLVKSAEWHNQDWHNQDSEAAR